MKLIGARFSGGLAPASTWQPAAPKFRLLEPPNRLRVPVTPHWPIDAIVTKPAGQSVIAGESLCESAPQSAASMLAPLPGKILDRARAGTLSGGEGFAVEMEIDRRAAAEHLADNSPLDAEVPNSLPRSTPLDMGGWIDRLRGAGVWADRHGSPDLIAQLQAGLQRPIDTILCNALDSDPKIRLNSAVASIRGAEIVTALHLLAGLTGAKRVWSAVEYGAPVEWWNTMRTWGRSANLKIIPLLNDYPQSDPALLLYTLLDRRLRPGRSPVEQGVLLLDAVAAAAIGSLILRDQPMTRMPIGIHDYVRKQTHYLVAPIGMSLRDVFEQIDVPADPAILRVDSPLRDRRVLPEAVVGGHELTVHATYHEPLINPEPCVRCGWCVEACPTSIQPAALLEASQRNDVEGSELFGVDACIDCGICTYVCPSRLPVLAGIRRIKAMRNE